MLQNRILKKLSIGAIVFVRGCLDFCFFSAGDNAHVALVTVPNHIFARGTEERGEKVETRAANTLRLIIGLRAIIEIYNLFLSTNFVAQNILHCCVQRGVKNVQPVENIRVSVDFVARSDIWQPNVCYWKKMTTAKSSSNLKKFTGNTYLAFVLFGTFFD